MPRRGVKGQAGRDRFYAAVVIGTLALTLGASTAVFSIVNGVLLRPLAYPQADDLVSIREILARYADRWRRAREKRHGALGERAPPRPAGGSERPLQVTALQ